MYQQYGFMKEQNFFDSAPIMLLVSSKEKDPLHGKLKEDIMNPIFRT